MLFPLPESHTWAVPLMYGLDGYQFIKLLISPNSQNLQFLLNGNMGLHYFVSDSLSGNITIKIKFSPTIFQAWINGTSVGTLENKGDVFTDDKKLYLGSGNPVGFQCDTSYKNVKLYDSLGDLVLEAALTSNFNAVIHKEI